jgi:photosystem II stability/assembly factor-like uncharacterized protein
MKRAWLLLAAVSLLLAGGGLLGCGGGGTEISTVVPRIDPEAHQRLLAALARHRARVAKANAGMPYSIAFWDTQRGLIGTGSQQYTTHPKYCYGTIALTADGGHSFDVVRRTSGIVTWVDTAGVQDAWAQVDQCGKVRGQFRRALLHSSDGGRSWQRLPISHQRAAGGVEVGVWKPSFSTATEGLATVAPDGMDAHLIAESAKLLVTSDGGRSWHQVAGPCRHSDGTAVSFPGPVSAWLVCTRSLGAGNEDKRVLASVDGARTWRAVAQVGLGNSPSQGLYALGYVQGLSFSDAGSGLLMFDEGRFMYLTEDGGRDWQAVRAASFPRLRGESGYKSKPVSTNSAVMLSPTSGFALLGYFNGLQQLATTTDAGQSWTSVHRWPPSQRQG